ncbi:MAG: SIS domain-containing protein [Candidatus Limiplasma sp.]|nr:SIS domain-containing protein [Clostridiales bacterium]MDY3815314.1 SIS domain-containing protein [Candidatus Limiplasma sp.]
MNQVLQSYQQELIQAIRQIDHTEFEKATALLLDAYHQDRQVFIVGNGGSAGTANHFVCDFGKNAVQGERRRFRIHSLCDNVEVITALGNDIAFEQIFAFQLGNQMRPGDVLMVISASGNSPDLVEACRYAKEHGGQIIAMSGFGGGKICDGAQVSLVTDMRSYERIEDLHLMLLHMIVCWFKENQNLL